MKVYREKELYIECKRFRQVKQFCGTFPFRIKEIKQYTSYSPNRCRTQLLAELLASSLVPSVETGLFQELCHVCWCGS